MVELANNEVVAVMLGAADLKLIRDLAEDDAPLCEAADGCKLCTATVMARMLLRHVEGK